MLNLMILLEFSETETIFTKSSEVGLFRAKEWSPGGVQKLSKGGPSRDPSESGYGPKHKDFLMFSKNDRVLA